MFTVTHILSMAQSSHTHSFTGIVSVSKRQFYFFNSQMIIREAASSTNDIRQNTNNTIVDDKNDNKYIPVTA